MSSPILEPYREEIFSMLRKGQSKADVWRTIERTRGVKISRSQFYAFAEQLSKDTMPENEEERVMPLREVRGSETPTADETVQAFMTGLPRAFDEFTARLTTLEQQSRELEQKTLSGLRHFKEELAGVVKRLEGLSTRPEIPSLPDKETRPEPTPEHDTIVATVTLRSIWKRAFIVSGVFWAVVELLLIRGYWRPLWDTARKWM